VSGVADADAAVDARPHDVPRWLALIDGTVIALINVALVAEVLMVFGNTMLRSLFASSALMGFDETSHPFLVAVAFLAGAVSYSRGQFIAIKVLVDRAPPAWREFLRAVGEWVVVVVSVLIGGYSIPLLIANAEERTILLGIGYAWLTVPITLGSALLVLHAGLALLGRPPTIVTLAALPVAAMWAAIMLAGGSAWVTPGRVYVVLALLFLVQIAAGVPIGFVLATVGMACVHTLGSGDMTGVVMNAQRGSSGFIFLALPFFVLAGFITDRADIGSRIVLFVASLIGHVRGGLLQVMVVGVYLSSSISGSKAADMATIGIPMNRMLDRYGYPPHERAALLAASAAMAESVPPAIALILIGSSTSISMGGLFLAGLLPAAVLALVLMAVVHLRASTAGWTPLPRAPRHEVWRAGRRAVLPLLMPLLLIGGLAGGIGTPTEVSTFAVLYGLLLGVLYGRMSGRGLWELLTEASLLNGMIFFTISAATVLSWALTLE
jgi:TRAP-type C4-dicarboxylate transport system permease small subunit